MSVIETAEAAVNPYAWAIKLGLYAVVGIALVASGWFAHGAFDGTKVAQAQTTVEKCRTARVTDAANANASANHGLTQSAGQAKHDNDDTDSTNNQRAAGYAGAGEEASHAKPSGVTIDVAPLRALFDGMRRTDDSAGGNARP